jgi:hypothetical protein
MNNLTEKQAKIVENLISEFTQINSQVTADKKSVTYFDKEFNKSRKRIIDCEKFYQEIKTHNLKIDADGRASINKLAEKLKSIFASYNILVVSESTSISLYIIVPEYSKKNMHIWFSLNEYVRREKVYFDVNNRMEIDKGIQHRVNNEIHFNGCDNRPSLVNVDEFENTTSFKQMTEEIFRNFGHLITRN